MSLLEIDDLSVGVTSGDAETELVHELSLTLESGQTLCIVGESGSGKTVTAMSIIRLLEFASPVSVTGSISLGDVDLTALTPEQMRGYRGRRIGMVFQEALDSLNPSQRIGTQLAEAHHPAVPGGSRRRSEAQARTHELLTEVGFADPGRIGGLYPHQLSGGMQQRVMIAMALMAKPDLLLADEPTTALDVTTQAEILRLFADVQREYEMGCVFITHDMGVAAEIADRIAVLYAGRLAEVGPAAEVLGNPRHRYTRALVDCVPQVGVRQTGGLPSIPGSVPGPAEQLPGCRFAPRCGYAVDDCHTTEPEVAKLDGDSAVACWNPGSGAVESARSEPDTDASTGPGSDTPAADEPILSIDQVRRVFSTRSGRSGPLGLKRREQLAAVDTVSLDVQPGEFFGLVGESGSGKTTLGQMTAALDRPSAGTITVGGHRHTPQRLEGDPRAFRRTIQLIFQDPQSSLDPRHTIGRIIAEPLRELTDLNAAARRERVAGLLDEVGLSSAVIDRIPDQISGGQRQRVAIARALAPEPELIVADEPTSALDVSVQGQVMNLLLDLRRRRNLSYLFITHNLNLILSIADRVGVMKDGKLIEVADPATIATTPQHEYTQTLLAANPSLSGSANPTPATA